MFKFQIESEIQHAIPSVLKALDASGLALFIKDERLNYIHANDNYKELLQCKEIIRKTDYDLYRPEVASELALLEEQVLRTEIAQTSDSVVVGKNNLERILEISRSVYTEGDQRYLVGVVKDVTEEKQKEQFDAYKKVLTGHELSEQILNRFSSYIFNNNDEQTILDGVGHLCIDLLKLEDISIFLYQEDTQILEQRTFVGSDNQLKYEAHNPVSLKLGEGIIGSAALHRSSTVIDNTRADERHVKGLVDSGSELAIPIIYKTRLIGVLDSEHSANNFFKKEHIQMLENIAGLLAIKLHEVKNYRALKAKKNQLESFIQHSPVSVVMLDEEYRYLSVSTYWRNTYGIAQTEPMIGRSHFEMNPNLPIRWKKMIKRAMEGEVVSLDKEFYQRKNGKRDWYQAKVAPWYKDEEQIGGVIIQAEIVTDSVDKERHHSNTAEELKEARRLGKLFAWEFNPETGQTKWTSGNLAEDSEQHEIASLVELVEEAYQDDFNKAVYEAIREKSEFQLIHPIQLRGKKRWVHTRGQLQLNGERIVKLFGTAQDITEQVQAEESLKSKNEELQRVNHALDQFVYKTAHDLRAPLTNLVGLIGVMRNEENPEVLKTYFDLQQKSVERMDAFIHKIADYTQNSRLEVQSECIDMPSLIDDVLKDYLFVPQSEKIEKLVELDINSEIYSDTERLRSMLSNLVSNAMHFADLTDLNPFLKIKVKADSQKVTMTLEDNGLGMSPAVQSRAFDMFYRGHSSAEGTGVGLYIVKEMVHKLNGKISLNSKEGKGTTVEIILPNLHPEILDR